MPLWAWLILVAAVTIGGLAFAAWWLLRSVAGETKAMARRIGRLPWRAKARLALALVRDRRVPLWVRLVIPALVLYLAMPLDIIPDFIPILGHLDDVLVVAVAVGLVLRFTSRAVLEEHLTALETNAPPLTPDP